MSQHQEPVETTQLMARAGMTRRGDAEKTACSEIYYQYSERP